MVIWSLIEKMLALSTYMYMCVYISKICRYSFSDKASYVLSIRDHDPKTNDACVKHYRIRKMDNGGFYISPRRTFPSMIKLIDHYQSKKKLNICSTYTEEKRCIGVNAQLISSSKFWILQDKDFIFCQHRIIVFIVILYTGKYSNPFYFCPLCPLVVSGWI